MTFNAVSFGWLLLILNLASVILSLLVVDPSSVFSLVSSLTTGSTVFSSVSSLTTGSVLVSSLVFVPVVVVGSSLILISLSVPGSLSISVSLSSNDNFSISLSNDFFISKRSFMVIPVGESVIINDNNNLSQ